MSTLATDVVAVVVCALQVEYQSIRDQMSHLSTRTDGKGTRYTLGRIAGVDGLVAALVAEPGQVNTAVLAAHAVDTLQARCVLFVGIAGSLKPDVRVGDVVVATRVESLHPGKAINGRIFPRQSTFPASHRLLQIAHEVEARGSWRLAARGKRRPVTHFKPIVSGELVLADRGGPARAKIRKEHDGAAAIEMEGLGLYQAAHLSGGVDALVIRGVSDSADETKALLDSRGTQKLAAENAALFVAATLRLAWPLTSLANDPAVEPDGPSATREPLVETHSGRVIPFPQHKRTDTVAQESLMAAIRLSDCLASEVERLDEPFTRLSLGHACELAELLESALQRLRNGHYQSTTRGVDLARSVALDEALLAVRRFLQECSSTSNAQLLEVVAVRAAASSMGRSMASIRVWA